MGGQTRVPQHALLLLDVEVGLRQGPSALALRVGTGVRAFVPGRERELRHCAPHLPLCTHLQLGFDGDGGFVHHLTLSRIHGSQRSAVGSRLQRHLYLLRLHLLQGDGFLLRRAFQALEPPAQLRIPQHRPDELVEVHVQFRRRRLPEREEPQEPLLVTFPRHLSGGENPRDAAIPEARGLFHQARQPRAHVGVMLHEGAQVR